MWVCSFFEWQAAGFRLCYALAAELSRHPEVERREAHLPVDGRRASDSKRSQGIAAVAPCSITWSTSGLVMLTWPRRPHSTWSRAQIAAVLAGITLLFLDEHAGGAVILAATTLRTLLPLLHPSLCVAVSPRGADNR